MGDNIVFNDFHGIYRSPTLSHLAPPRNRGSMRLWHLLVESLRIGFLAGTIKSKQKKKKGKHKNIKIKMRSEEVKSEKHMRVYFAEWGTTKKNTESVG